MGARILVVDDEFVNRHIIGAILRLEGYEVVEAEDGPTALGMMVKPAPDLVLLDIMMPRMDGYEVCQRMQEDSLLREIPVIFVTALTDLQKEAEAFAWGAVDYITKPVNAATLKARVRAHLQLKRQRHLLREQNERLERIAAELQEANEHLELRVMERTGELARKNAMLEREIEERRATQRALEKAREEAERASQAKSAFLATISHEVRTPMTGAIGMLNLALETELSLRQQEYLCMAKSSAVAMLDMLNNILDFSRAESGRLLMETVAFQPAAVLQTVMELEAIMAREKGLYLEGSIADEVPATLVGDPIRLRQILLNLVRNAIKFTDRGGIRVTCRRRREGAAGAEAPPRIMLHFTVQDTGAGIPPEAQERIFSPFVQADASTTRKFGGVGLGLSICKKLVEMMEGRIWVESVAGAGANFHFTACFAEAPEVSEGEPAGAAHGARGEGPAGTPAAQGEGLEGETPGVRRQGQATKPPAISKGFDFERALALSGDRTALAGQLRDFFAATPGLLREAGEAATSRAPARLGEVLQILRAAAAGVGATALGDEAFRLQLAVRRDDWDRAQPAVVQLARLFSNFKRNVRDSGVLGRREPEGAALPTEGNL